MDNDRRNCNIIIIEENIDENNFILNASKHYDNPGCVSWEEFESDIRKIKFIRKLFSRKEKGKKFNYRLVLNHIITLYNVFGNYTTILLFYKVSQTQWNTLQTFLIFLNRMPDVVKINNDHIRKCDISIDLDLFSKLENIQ